jgi:hypothetical protein
VGESGGYPVAESSDREHLPRLRAWSVVGYHTSGVPLVFTHTHSPPPYGVGLMYKTPDMTDGAEAVVDRLAVRYPDDTEVDLTDRVPAPVPARREESQLMRDGVWVRTLCLRAKWQVDDAVTRAGAFTLLVRGSLRKDGRSLEAFDAAIAFHPAAGGAHYSTGWWKLLTTTFSD